MSRKGIIISGGSLDTEFTLQILKEIHPEYVIGVDRGLTFLYHNQVMPTHIVGDFDSVEPEIIAYYKENTDIPIREFDPVKDASDTEIAVRLAIELGVEHLWILGATGTRLDHVIANIQTLKIAHDARVKTYILDKNNRISLIEKEFCLGKNEQYGKYFSVFPLGETIEKFSIVGAKYSLQNHTLCPSGSLCVSNEIEEEKIEITYPKGIVIFMETKE